MNSTAASTGLSLGRDRFAGSCRDSRLVFSLLEKIEHGLLELRLPDGSERLFGHASHGGAHASLEVRDERLFARVLARGDIGLAESWLDGDWDSPDPAALLTLLAANRAVLGRALYGNAWSLLLARVRHWLNDNSRAGSRRNILAHYDLGNDFYSRWLDPGMTYSSAIFSPSPLAGEGRGEGGGSLTLAAAQEAKYARILDRLAPNPGDSLLEIGCGWGGMAEAAVAAGLQHTGVTLSPSQLDWARQRVPQADLRLQDYRDLAAEGQRYDHLVSIEMFEAVGERHWPTYFRTLRDCLQPGGKAVVQSIVIRDDLFAAYRRGTDFIQQYIFPGGMLPSPTVFKRAANRVGLAVTDVFAFGQDYATTLVLWRERFCANWAQIAPLGFDERFRRLWTFYLAYCEAGFRAGNIDVVQFELQHASA